MPEFERKKRKSLTDKQLYDEYYGINKKTSSKSPSKNGKSANTNGKRSASAKKGNSKPVKRKNPPVSPERQRIREMYPEENAVRPIKSSGRKTNKRKTTKKGSVPKKGRNSTNRSGTAGKNRKKKHGSYVLYYFLCGIVSLGVVAVLSVTVLFNIGRFEVIGDAEYSEEEIIEAAGIAEGENLLRIDTAAAENRITSQLVYIDKAKVNRGFPDKLVITVEPAVPLASFYIGGKYYLVSERGRVLDISGSRGDYPVITGYVLDPVKEMTADTKTVIGGQLDEDEDKRVTAAKNIIGYMKSSGLNEAYSIDLTDILSIKVFYDDRIELELGTTAAMDEKIYHAGLLILDPSSVAENEKCVIIATNPNRMSKRLIREGEIIDNGYVVTTAPETEPEPLESEPGNEPEGTG